MRWNVGGRAVAKAAASTSQMGRFVTEFLAADENFAALANLCGQRIVSPTHITFERWPEMSGEARKPAIGG
jgi:hypothetical protein